ncbi:hypothetical protein K493DRAFT_384992, partial [Basidiobolus meristosporus CBS 931.73]
VSLISADTAQPEYIHPKCLTGTTVSSLYRLKDIDNSDGGFFVFPDVSVRLEGQFRLRFSLYEINGTSVDYINDTVSDPFTVYAPKQFPGMSESTLLSRYFAEQGVRIRIRKENRVRNLRYWRFAPSVSTQPSDTDPRLLVRIFLARHPNESLSKRLLRVCRTKMSEHAHSILHIRPQLGQRFSLY